MTNTSVAIVFGSFGPYGRASRRRSRRRCRRRANDCHLIAVEDVDANWEELDDADAIIFGRPT